MNILHTFNVQRPALFAAIVLTMLVTVGCDSVSVTEPIGEPVDAKQAKALAGVYKGLGDERTFELRHVEQNHLRVGGIEWNESEHIFEVKQMDVRLTTIGQYMIANLHGEEQEDDHYSFILVNKTHQGLVIWGADVPRFAQAVEAGDLAGSVKQGEHDTTHVTLTDANDVTAYLKDKSLTDYFLWNEPTLMQRVDKK